MRPYLVALVSVVLCSSCLTGGDEGSGALSRPSRLAADNDNLRIAVVSEGTRVEEAALSFIDATTNSLVSGRPLIDRHHNDDLQSVLSYAPTAIAALASSDDATSTRVFVAGSVEDADSGDRVTNRLSVFDFDGEAIALADFSPIEVVDEDDATDDATSILSAIAADGASERLFVLNKTLSKLFVYSAADGTQVDNSPIDVTGTPEGLALERTLRYAVVSSALDAGGGRITVIDLDDFTVLAEIDLDEEVRDIGIASTDAGTVLVTVARDEPALTLYRLDVGGASVESIGAVTNSAETTETSNDSSQETLITGTLAAVEIAQTSTGDLYAYAAQSDGNLLVAHLDPTLSEVSTFALETHNELQQSIAISEDADSGVSADVYVTSTHDGLVDVTPVGDESDFARIR